MPELLAQHGLENRALDQPKTTREIANQLQPKRLAEPLVTICKADSAVGALDPIKGRRMAPHGAAFTLL
jgi:hypothetical protein